MEGELHGLSAGRVNFQGAITAVVEELAAGERRAEADTEGLPKTRVMQSGGQPPDGSAKKTDGRDAGQQPAFPEN